MASILILAAAGAAGTAANDSGPLWALIALIAIGAAWFAGRVVVRSLQARKTTLATGGRYNPYVLEVLVNAAKVDGRVNDAERQVIAAAYGEATGETIDPPVVANAFAHARLSKAELVAFLAHRSGHFSHEQKTALLKALLAVFVADGKFEETEHAALIDYTEAIGFDRVSAPELLRGLAGQIRRGNII